MDIGEATKILGVSSDADTDTLKKAYRRACAKAHPDNGGSEDAFNKVSEAYKFILNYKPVRAVHRHDIHHKSMFTFY